jgi:hypothetical protein
LAGYDIGSGLEFRWDLMTIVEKLGNTDGRFDLGQAIVRKVIVEVVSISVEIRRCTLGMYLLYSVHTGDELCVGHSTERFSSARWGFPF